jgi:hypothetical protein
MDILLYLLLLGVGFGAAATQSGYDPGPEAAMEAPAVEEAPDEAAEAAPEQMPFAAFEAEDQTATGRMITATEIRPILSITKPSWVAVREWDGNDLLYFTNLLAWRCGVHEIRYAINDGADTVLEIDPCYLDEGSPNALKAEEVLPYVVLPLGSVDTVRVDVLYDDLSTDSAAYSRQSIRID